MFPLRWNFPFRKKDGSITTIDDAISEGGGGGGGYTLPTASAETKGGIKIGSGLAMEGEVLNNTNPTAYTLPTASAETKGGVKIGSGLAMEGEVLNNTNPTAYTLPTASAETKGGIKVGSGLSITDDTLSVESATDNATITLTGIFGTPYAKVHKTGSHVIFELSVMLMSEITSANNLEIGSVPNTFIPSRAQYILGIGTDENSNRYPIQFNINTNGKIYLSFLNIANTKVGVIDCTTSYYL